jgi:predicted nicotinamide N-methyase
MANVGSAAETTCTDDAPGAGTGAVIVTPADEADGPINGCAAPQSSGLSGSLSILSSGSEIEHDADDDEKTGGYETNTVHVPQRPNMSTLFASATAVTKSSVLTKTLKSLAWRSRYSQEEKYPVTLSVPPSQPVTYYVDQIQAGEIDGTYGTGATVWPASVVLIHYLELQAAEKSDYFEGKSIIDLGAGTCVASIACALLGARLIVATDGNDHCVELATSILDKASSELKEVITPPKAVSDGERRIGRSEIRVRSYWWGKNDLAMLEELDQPHYDFILCSDVVLPKLYPIEPLVKAIAALSGPNTVAYVSYEHRYYNEFDPRERFFELCEESGLEVKVIPHSEYHPSYCVDDIEIWTICRTT